jgi:hypothetical protein
VGCILVGVLLYTIVPIVLAAIAGYEIAYDGNPPAPIAHDASLPSSQSDEAAMRSSSQGCCLGCDLGVASCSGGCMSCRCPVRYGALGFLSCCNREQVVALGDPARRPPGSPEPVPEAAISVSGNGTGAAPPGGQSPTATVRAVALAWAASSGLGPSSSASSIVPIELTPMLNGMNGQGIGGAAPLSGAGAPSATDAAESTAPSLDRVHSVMGPTRLNSFEMVIQSSS